MSEDDLRQEAEIRRQRLRDQIKDQDDVGQRTMVRNWVTELMVDHEMLRESFEEFASKTGHFHAQVDSALFKGDKDTGAPGLVPFTNRIATLLDSGCKFVKWGAGIFVTVATLLTPVWVPIVLAWVKGPVA